MMDYNEIFRNRIKKLAIAVIQLFSGLKYSDEIAVIRKQIICSITSVATNYRALLRARSDKERYVKLCIVIEEADERLFWLELRKDLELLTSEQLISVKSETEEILKSTATYREKLSNK